MKKTKSRSKPKRRLAHTPWLDSWLNRTERQLNAVPEARTALALWLPGHSTRYWQNRLPEMFNRRRKPNAELVLMINDFVNKELPKING